VQAGYTDGRITNWKNRGIPRAEVGAVAQLMGVRYEDYLEAAGEKNVNQVQEVRAGYGVSDEALEIARAFDQLQPQAKEYIREQVFIYTVVDKSMPWLRHGRPIGKTYADFEKWHQENISTKRDFELQRPASSREPSKNDPRALSRPAIADDHRLRIEGTARRERDGHHHQKLARRARRARRRPVGHSGRRAKDHGPNDLRLGRHYWLRHAHVPAAAGLRPLEFLFHQHRRRMHTQARGERQRHGGRRRI
jgi:hypothetical protein